MIVELHELKTQLFMEIAAGNEPSSSCLMAFQPA